MRDKELIGVAEGVALVDVCGAIFEASLQRDQRRRLKARKRCAPIPIIDKRTPTRTERVVDFRRMKPICSAIPNRCVLRRRDVTIC